MGEAEFHLADKLILGLLAHGPPASVTALAEAIGVDDGGRVLKGKIYALAAAGLVEGAGRGNAGQMLWRVTAKGAKAAGGSPPVGPAMPPEPEPAPAPVFERSRPALKLTVPPRSTPGEVIMRKIKPVRPRAGRVVQLRPMTPERARFCRWFLRADWPADTVAMLFDVDVADVHVLAAR